MKISFILPYPSLAGGIRVIAIYAARLQARGHRVTLVSMPATVHGRRAKALVTMRRWFDLADPAREPSHLDGLAVEHRRLSSARVTDHDVPDGDVVIATWWETAPWVAKLSPSKGAKAYFIQHYEIHEGQPIERVKATWPLPLHKIVVARWLADVARDEFGDAKATIVPNSVDPELFNAPPRGKQAVPTVGMMYASQPYKGSDICIGAYELAGREIPALRLLAFGTADLAQTNLPAEATYTQRPAQHQLRDIYASCDAWLFGSRSEGFGLPILEALACRTPVIATPAGAAPDLLAGGGGGVLVRHEDPADMARALCNLVNLPDSTWRAMSEAARTTATRYTWDDATDLFEAALVRAAQAKPRMAAVQIA